MLFTGISSGLYIYAGSVLGRSVPVNRPGIRSRFLIYVYIYYSFRSCLRLEIISDSKTLLNANMKTNSFCAIYNLIIYQ